MTVKKNFPEAVTAFIVPPSIEELEARLRGRGTETEEQIVKRLKRALEEFSMIENYDYIIENNTAEGAADDLMCILRAERLKQARYEKRF